jgi:hypothetical protein
VPLESSWTRSCSRASSRTAWCRAHDQIKMVTVDHRLRLPRAGDHLYLDREDLCAGRARGPARDRGRRTRRPSTPTRRSCRRAGTTRFTEPATTPPPAGAPGHGAEGGSPMTKRWPGRGRRSRAALHPQDFGEAPHGARPCRRSTSPAGPT